MHGESSSDPEDHYGELLAEPIIQLAMKADGVEEAALRGLLRQAASSLKTRTANDLPATRREVLVPRDGARNYRRGVGILLLSRLGKAFVGRRIDTDAEAWQLPHGGIENGECRAKRPCASYARRSAPITSTSSTRWKAGSSTTCLPISLEGHGAGAGTDSSRNGS